MATLPALNELNDATNTVAQQKTDFEDLNKGIKQIPGAPSGTAVPTLTIASGSVTPGDGVGGIFLIDTESAAATDDLTNILQTNLPEPSLLLIGLANAAHVVTVKHNAGGAGQISLSSGGDCTLGDTTHWLCLFRSGSLWKELWRVPTLPVQGILQKTANYTATVADRNKLIEATSGTWTLTLPPAASAGKGFCLDVKNSGPGVVTIDGNSSETIDGLTTVALYLGESYLLFCDGSNWKRIGTIGFSTGDVKLTIKTTADPGWVLMNDGTLGSAASGATTRANADTEGLFALLWNNTADANCPVSGGRGASAAADFAANKTIALPKALGRALACYGAGSGLTSRVLALATGAEDAIVVSHTHGVTDPGHSHRILVNAAQAGAGGGIYGVNGSTDIGKFTDGATTNISINSTGSSGTGANMQPTAFLNVMIKL